MARKKKRGGAKKNTIVRYRQSKPKIKYRTRFVKKNVTRKPRRTIFGGLNLAGTVKALLPLTCGALTAKFAAKKFADGGAEGDDWTWKNYAWGVVGTTIAAFGVSALFRRSKAANYVLLGGLGLITYKLVCLELAPKSQYLESWFGQDEDIYPDMSGNMWDGGTTQYVQGADQAWRPIDESHRMVGADIVPADPSFGADIVPADPSFGESLTDEYARAYQ